MNEGGLSESSLLGTVQTAWVRVGRSPEKAGTQDQGYGLTFHLLLAKFFLICSLTDWWIFLSRAVSPAILGWVYVEGCL